MIGQELMANVAVKCRLQLVRRVESAKCLMFSKSQTIFFNEDSTVSKHFSA